MVARTRRRAGRPVSGQRRYAILSRPEANARSREGGFAIDRRDVAAVYLATLLTGAAGLAYQVVWQRYLARLLGSDALATATVIAVFLGGLAAGYALCGWLSAHVRNVFRTYGWLEAGIGLWALAFPWLFAAVELVTRGWGFAPPWWLAIQGTLCAALLIGPPALCMGATVPMLTRGLPGAPGELTRVHARVYAVNTAGAVAGTLAAGFVLVEWLGLPGTLRAASAANLLAAAFFVVAAGRLAGAPGARAAAGRAALAHPVPSTAGAAAGRPSTPQPAGESVSRAPVHAVHAIAFLGGFAFMTVEAALVRLVHLSLGASGYSFALVVAALVLAIAAGAWSVARRPAIGPRAVAHNQLLVAASLLLLFPTLDAWPWAAHVLRIGFAGSPTAFVLFHATAFAVLAAVLLVPGGAMGATLPLLFDRLRAASVGRAGPPPAGTGGPLGQAGWRAGRLYAWNALGNLAGGLTGGYALYRWLDLGGVWLLAALLSAVSAALAAGLAGAGRAARSPRAAAVGLAAAALLAAIWMPGHEARHFAAGTFRLRSPIASSYAGPAAFYRDFYATRDVLAYRDDPAGTFAVIENPPPLEALARRFPDLAPSLEQQRGTLAAGGPPPRSILVNGKADSSTFYDRETLLLAAHLPALLVPSRENVMVVGLGTGVTAGELALYPDVASLEVAELAPAVVDFLPLFAESNHSVHLDPRLRIVPGDAFRVIGRSDRRWDLIVSEPSNPWMTGVDQLFSREFYRTVRGHLAERGLFVQWVQRYATTEEIAALAVNTLRAEFPYVRAFKAGESDDLFLASTWPIGPRDFLRAQARLDQVPTVRASLALIRVFDVEGLAARERPGAIERAAEYAGRELESLDRPRIHYLSGRAFFAGDSLDASRAALGF